MDNFPPHFVGCFVKLHNQYRARHKSPPLKLDKKLSEYAQEWAENLAKRGVLCYRPDTKYGENIFVSFWRDVPHTISPKDPIETWYREGKYFKYGEPKARNLKDVRHFTQLVWKSTKTMGLGMASGADGKIYVVCNYHPRGNIDGEFAENVMPSSQDKELLPHEAEGIRTIEPRMEVVRSMERLYAVPSEKLRVWSVWLTKIGEIADEWQKWLHAHIDLAVRLADHLRAAEEAIRGPKEEKEQEKGLSDEDDGTITPDMVDESVQGGEEVEAEVAGGEEVKSDVVGGEEVEADDEDHFRELYTAGEAGAKSMAVIHEPSDKETGKSPEKSGEGSPSTETEESSDVTLTPDSIEESDATLTPETAEDGSQMVWPIGLPWKHTGPPPKVEPEPEPLPLPRNEEEMRQFLREFTHQATIYRSYYKHWNETADQAIKEIGGRVVMATYKIRGEGVPARKKVLRSQASRNLSVSKAKSRSKREISKSKSKSIDKAEPAEPVPEPAEQKSVTTAESEYITPNSSTSDTPTVIENPPNPSPSNQEPNPARSSNGTLTRQLKVEPSTESVEVDDWVRDNARASEPIPYIFYLRAEPDIQIAIEHDDELVIDADPDRESIVGCHARLFYNLKDKPCKGGKPWI